MTSVGDIVLGAVYAPDEQPVAIHFANGLDKHFAYDIRARLTQTDILHRGHDARFFRETLAYDPASNILGREREVASRRTVENFDYDDLHRLVSAHRIAPNGATKGWKYQYDRTGDLVAATVNGAIVSTTVDRDDSGRVVRTDDLAISWDAEGRLASARGRGMNLSNVYDYEGRRVVRRLARLADSKADEHLLSLFRDYEHHGKRAVKFIKLFGGMVATVETSLPEEPQSPEKHYHHTDHLGSSIIRFDGMGTSVGESAFAPYGALESNRGVESFGRGFTGAPQDGSLGLTAFEARYLHEATGRFLSPDPALLHISKPLASPQALNLYAYSLNRPYTFIDRDGRFPLPVVLGAGLWQHREAISAGYHASTRWGENLAQASADRLVRAGGGIADDPLAAAVGLVASLWTPETAPRTMIALSYAASGPALLRNSYQWVRFGSSYSRATGPTGFSIKLGAGKAKYWRDGQRIVKDYAETIPRIMRGLNRSLRNLKLPGISDKGHIHIIKNPIFSSSGVRKGVDKVLEGIQRLAPSGGMGWYFWKRGNESSTSNDAGE